MVPGPAKISFTCYCSEKSAVLIIHNANYDAQSLFIRAKPFARRGSLVVLEQDIETGSFKEVYFLPSELPPESGEVGDPPLPIAVNEYILNYEDRFEEEGQEFIRSIKTIQVFDVWTSRGRYPTRQEIEQRVLPIKDEVEGYIVYLNGERIV